MIQTQTAYVLDSFALLAFFQDEPGAQAVEDLLLRAEEGRVDLSITTANLGEVIYRTIRKYGSDRADDALTRIDAFAISITDIDRDLALDAARLKGVYRVSYADCLAAALGRQLGAPVVTGDPDFRRLEGEVEVEWLSAPDESLTSGSEA